MIVAIFLLVVLATLGAFIVSITSSQQIGSAYDIEGARAYEAAHYGNEWGAYQVLRGDEDPANTGFVPAISCSTAGTFCALCRAATYAAPTSTNLSGLTGSLSGFTVTVTCGGGIAAGGSYAEGDAAKPVWAYQITATACNQPTAGACPNTTAAAVGSIGYIERMRKVIATN